MRGVLTRAIVRPPGHNFAKGLTTSRLGMPDYRQALQQHADYCAALEECGLELVRMEADERYPDSCFVEDTAILLADRRENRKRISPVLTRPGASTRQGEVADMRSALASLFPWLHEIQAPGTLDGGDICEAEAHFFIGLSERTNVDGARQLSEIVETQGYTTSLVDIRGIDGLLHLKSGVAYLSENRLAVNESLAQRDEFKGYELIHVDPSENYAANCISINGRVLVAAGHSNFETKLCELGYRTIVVEMSEFQKMDGGLSCLSLRW